MDTPTSSRSSPSASLSTPEPSTPAHDSAHASLADQLYEQGVIDDDNNNNDSYVRERAALVEQQQLVSPTPNGGSHSELDLLGREFDHGASPMPRATSATPVTRTVAIIKNHALHYRFDIEPRIQEASFEIVKERQMEFDTETDPEVLYELFGEDADSLAEGPVWVYVLERRRAVEVWNTLMGPRDPELARVEAPNSLRALYGISLVQNGLMGSPDTQTAEMQIAALFASSPPFRTTDLPSEHDAHYGSMRSTSSSILDALRASQSPPYAASSATNASTANGSKSNNSGGSTKPPLFKARPIPLTNIQPDIAPRMSRAAVIRMNKSAGIPLDNNNYNTNTPTKPRTPLSKERLATTFANVPGHKRTETIAVASTAPPVIAPRMTKAASLRIGKEAGGSPGGRVPAPPPLKKKSVTEGGVTPMVKATFEGVPGHKRRETISVASVRPPTVTPRLNKSAALRQMQKEGTQSPSTPSRTNSSPKAATLSRATSAGARRHSVVPVSSSTPASTRRASSVLGVHTPTSISTAPAAEGSPATGGVTRPASAAAKTRPRPSSISSPPSITPRTNKSAALRAAKQAEAEAEKQQQQERRAQRAAKPPPSSFKAIVT